MSYITAMNPITGQTQYIEAEGDPNSTSNPARLVRSDPVVQSRLASIEQKLDTLFAPLTPYTHTNSAAAVVKTSPGTLRSLYLFNNSTSDTCFLMFFNRTSLPPANDTNWLLSPIIIFPGQEKAIGQDIFGLGGMAFSIGIAYGLSSNQNQYTAIATPTNIRMFLGYR